ncbi:hypothetical protein PGTUg99_021454 [Puccinia graminis f. sp. tritici]|uniref:Uncharacterized protein n=1 Tax=Puccinia graminis f. sp. tritici TaxID=56615 RepID=A0A5B0NM17_PUCGR|nr:hypothetical protein PGTUg99_021454 [Puccinia graminis f. sp. tritici]
MAHQANPIPDQEFIYYSLKFVASPSMVHLHSAKVINQNQALPPPAPAHHFLIGEPGSFALPFPLALIDNAKGTSSLDSTLATCALALLFP